MNLLELMFKVWSVSDHYHMWFFYILQHGIPANELGGFPGLVMVIKDVTLINFAKYNL